MVAAPRPRHVSSPAIAPERARHTKSTAKEVVEIRSTSMHTDEPIVEEVLGFEQLPPGSPGSRRAIVRWSDGTVGEGITFYDDEVLSPVDHVGRQ